MILGLAIPRLHTTWYATKLSVVEVTAKDLTAPQKGNKYTGNEFRNQVRDLLKKKRGKKHETMEWKIIF